MDPLSAAMNGGDDNRLLFVVPLLYLEKFRREFQTFDIIGHLAQPEAGTVLVTPEGVEFPVKAQGWPEE
jgi:thiamine-monophosphate kinase